MCPYPPVRVNFDVKSIDLTPHDIDSPKIEFVRATFTIFGAPKGKGVPHPPPLSQRERGVALATG